MEPAHRYRSLQGANLSKFLQSGQLVYIDGLTHLHDNTHTDLSCEQDTKKAICFSLDKSVCGCGCVVCGWVCVCACMWESVGGCGWVSVGVPLFLPVHANDGHAAPPPPPLSRNQSNCLAGLYSFLSRLIKPHLSSGRPVAVIIDDLSVLLGQGVGLGEVVDFVHYCQVLVCHSSEESGVSVCVCVCLCMHL